MANKICILDEILASKIAAGEVVERPASVVKELVENSIDAGAKRIDIEVHNGGKSLIRVTDDGSGMNKEDALLSLERHATSKISSIDDLFNISTLGFRGEALPSVSAISRLELLTNDGTSGTKISVEGGKMIEKKETGCPKGTSIIVKDLFFNTPARMKYMRSDQTEQNHITDIVSKFVMSSPSIAFKLISNGKEIISSSGNGDLLDAISSVYGPAFAKDLLALGREDITGYISKPAVTKFNKEYQLFFVNGRYIKNYLISKAVENAYSNLIPKDRHPVAILFIRIDPDEIDVNVHPAKKEIKFEKTKDVMGSVFEAVKDALIDISPAKLISTPYIPDKKRWTSEMQRVWIEEPIMISGGGTVLSPTLSRPGNLIDADLLSENAVESQDQVPYPIAQLANTYIICVDGSDLILIDQHAAHERILYEKLRSSKSDGKNSQVCLIPEVIELGIKEFSLIEGSINILKEIGFDIEVFGKNCLRIKGIPSDTTGINIKGAVSDIALQLEEDGKTKKTEEVKDKILKLVACHGAIKAGDPLERKEMQALIKDLYSTTNPSTCPHGRPSIVKIERTKIASFFDRNK
ncbi:MAG: DNA mismatch repair endonuclease MutL [Candidatus Saganbacteria bacterium]|nr:DNA mismatch repair endonuclease MutL [Candidatus Saganbacteria bacterium]